MKLYLFALTAALLGAPPANVKWIAHRGGVVDPSLSENSPASLEAAIKHQYWMIESDIRETKDGKIITHHDPDFQRFYNDPREASSMTLAEIRQLRANPGNTPPMTFAELMAGAKGRLQLMLDVKAPDHGPAFYQEMEAQLRKANLLEQAYIIGLPSAHAYFKGKCRISIETPALKEAIARGENVAKTYFLFEWGKVLDAERVEFARKHGVEVVPSVNTFHYSSNFEESVKLGSADIRKLKKLGVTQFQIDSVYEPAFLD